MTNVYIWPATLGGSSFYGDEARVRSKTNLFGAPAQRVETTPRARVTIAGETVRSNADDLHLFLARLAGGVHLAGLWDLERVRFGWDLEPALNTSTGAEFWHVTGNTSIYADDAADGTTWRSIYALTNGAASEGAVSLPIDGLLPGEVIPKGCTARIGVYRYYVRTAVTANGSGQATLALAHPLRADVTDNTQVRIPGDFAIFSLISKELSPADADGYAPFTLTFLEAYSGEVDSLAYVVD